MCKEPSRNSDRAILKLKRQHDMFAGISAGSRTGGGCLTQPTRPRRPPLRETRRRARGALSASTRTSRCGRSPTAPGSLSSATTYSARSGTCSRPTSSTTLTRQGRAAGRSQRTRAHDDTHASFIDKYPCRRPYSPTITHRPSLTQRPLPNDTYPPTLTSELNPPDPFSPTHLTHRL